MDESPNYKTINIIAMPPLLMIRSLKIAEAVDFVNIMAVLITNEAGWVISHELRIKNIYEKTVFENEIKSYSLNPALFEIEIPFVKHRKVKDNSIKIENPDVKIVINAHEILLNLYENLNRVLTSTHQSSNKAARFLAHNFYSKTPLPQPNFFGGNSSSEALVSSINEELYLIPKSSFFYCYDVRNISEHLKNDQFDCILLDPPWWNKFIRRKKKKNNKFGYEMVCHKDLSNIAINNLLNSEGIVGIWCTSAPSNINAILTELFPAWGLQYIAQWFWLKVTKHGQPICDFSQNLGKQPFERIIFGAKKKLRSYQNPENNKVIMSIPSAVHSHKPPLCEVLKPYLPAQPKCLELFARYLLPGWTSYGNEVLKLQHISLYNEESEGS